MTAEETEIRKIAQEAEAEATARLGIADPPFAIVRSVDRDRTAPGFLSIDFDLTWDFGRRMTCDVPASPERKQLRASILSALLKKIPETIEEHQRKSE